MLESGPRSLRGGWSDSTCYLTSDLRSRNPIRIGAASRAWGDRSRGGSLCRLDLRRLPKIISLPQQRLWGSRIHAHRPGDRCFLYYNQSARMPNYLALKYVISYAEASFATARCARGCSIRLPASNRAMPCFATWPMPASRIGCCVVGVGSPIVRAAGIGISSSGSMGITPRTAETTRDDLGEL